MTRKAILSNSKKSTCFGLGLVLVLIEFSFRKQWQFLLTLKKISLDGYVPTQIALDALGVISVL